MLPRNGWTCCLMHVRLLHHNQSHYAELPQASSAQHRFDEDQNRTTHLAARYQIERTRFEPTLRPCFSLWLSAEKPDAAAICGPRSRYIQSGRCSTAGRV